MKKRDRSVEVADLDAIAHFEDDLVLFIAGEDENTPDSLCVQANFNKGKFDTVQPMGIYLESNSYFPIQDGETQMSYRQRLKAEMNPDVLAAMLMDFTQKRWLKLENPEFFLRDNFPNWEPGG